MGVSRPITGCTFTPPADLTDRLRNSGTLNALGVCEFVESCVQLDRPYPRSFKTSTAANLTADAGHASPSERGGSALRPANTVLGSGRV